MQYENSTHDSYNYDFAKDSNTMVHVAFTQFFCSAHVSLSSVRAEMCVFSHFIYTSTLKTFFSCRPPSPGPLCPGQKCVNEALTFTMPKEESKLEVNEVGRVSVRLPKGVCSGPLEKSLIYLFLFILCFKKNIGFIVIIAVQC